MNIKFNTITKTLEIQVDSTDEVLSIRDMAACFLSTLGERQDIANDLKETADELVSKMDPIIDSDEFCDCCPDLHMSTK